MPPASGVKNKDELDSVLHPPDHRLQLAKHRLDIDQVRLGEALDQPDAASACRAAGESGDVAGRGIR